LESDVKEVGIFCSGLYEVEDGIQALVGFEEFGIAELGVTVGESGLYGYLF
jgi:hypothetical protein